MSQHDSLRERTEQHKPKNSKSKIDDKEVYQAMELVKQYLKSKKDFQSYFENDWDLEFSAEIEIKYMIDFIKRKRIRSEFCYDCIDRKIIPDGGVLYLVNKKKNEKSKDMFNIMKEAIPEIKDIRFTNKLSNHPVCLSSAGEISVEMEKALNSMPIDNKISAEKVLEINEKHKIAKKLNELYKEDKKTLKKYAKVLYAQARLIEGLSIENPTEISNLMTEIMSK